MSNIDKEKPVEKQLGDFGEKIAKEILKGNGYEQLKIFDKEGLENFPYADILAEKDGKRCFISVKTRCRYGKNGENLSYNINREKGEALKKVFKAEAYWIAVTIDNKERKYSICFGLLKEIGESHAISIPKCREKVIGKWLIEEWCPLTDEWKEELEGVFDN